jgi:6-phosphogluconate dehydrogenase
VHRNLAKCEIGVFGVGFMGSNIALRLASRGKQIAVYDRVSSKIADLMDRASKLKLSGIVPAITVDDFVDLLESPPKVLIMVNEDEVPRAIEELVQKLPPGAAVADGGNTFFKNTRTNAKTARGHELLYLGVGISGGREVALNGGCVMIGGTRQAYEMFAPHLKALARGDSIESWEAVDCDAGHFVKMVHNGIEYALLQLIAEAVQFLQVVLGQTTQEIRQTFEAWRETELRSHLVDLTVDVLGYIDSNTGKPLVESILDSASQKGTGMRAAQTAMELGVPTPTIQAAVSTRNISAYKEQRVKAHALYRDDEESFGTDLLWAKENLVKMLKDALYCSEIVSYAQGFDLLRKGSDPPPGGFDYPLDLARIARIWAEGSVIRARFLDTIELAYARDPDLPNLLLNETVAEVLRTLTPSWRTIVTAAKRHGVPVPGMASSLDYFDSYRCEKLPANIIQALRDSFGAHGYERITAPGQLVHSDWGRSKSTQSSGITASSSEIHPNKVLVALKFSTNILAESLKHPGKGFIISTDTGEVEPEPE